MPWVKSSAFACGDKNINPVAGQFDDELALLDENNKIKSEHVVFFALSDWYAEAEAKT